MKRKFTKGYLEKHLIYDWSSRTRFDSRATCTLIKTKFPLKLKQYQKMLKKQFNLNKYDVIWKIDVFAGPEEIALLRVLLLQSFEQAILNGEV